MRCSTRPNRATPTPVWWRDRLLYLLDTAAAFDDSDEDLFTAEERERIVLAVADLRILDPAVGSGAFLLSMLHTLTLVLRRLDPRNELWEAVQRQRAADRAKETYLARPDDAARKAELEGVDETFQTYRESDFGRKLYLVQNCLHGTDIQPVAGLIAKLRFFISLAIEQETSRDPALNYGVRPLPNLETRIIAADTLIGVPRQAAIRTSDQERVEADLRANRERHFHATTWPEKQDCRERDEKLRQALSDELLRTGLSSTDARRVAEWNPYDQNASASWFDTEYMFGERGFDIVIGNPPYRQLQKDGGARPGRILGALSARRFRHQRRRSRRPPRQDHGGHEALQRRDGPSLHSASGSVRGSRGQSVPLRSAPCRGRRGATDVSKAVAPLAKQILECQGDHRHAQHR